MLVQARRWHKLLLALGLTLALAELGVRLVPAPAATLNPAGSYRGYPGGLWRPSRRCGFEYVPGFSGVFLHRGGRGVRFNIDGDGLRAVGAEPGGGAGAILFTGDSVTFGPAVGDAETFPALAGQMLGVAARNGGVNSYGLEQIRRRICDLLPRLHPRAIVLVLNLNDLEPLTLPAYIARAFADRGLALPQGIPVETVTPGALPTKYGILERSALFGLLRKVGARAAVRFGLVPDAQERYFESILARWRGPAGDACLHTLERLITHCRNAGIPLLIVFPPYAYQWDAAPGSPLLEPQRRVGELCRRLAVPFLDPRSQWARLPDRSDLLLPADPQHLSRRGHAWLARLLRKSIRALLEKHN